MGLSNVFLNDLCELKARNALDGFSSVIEIGAQQLSNAFLRSNDLLSRCYQVFEKREVALGEAIDSPTVDGLEWLSEQNPSSRHFWNSIGFQYASVEFDGHRDSIALDLNRDSVPKRMRNAYDLVVNTGTTEHVANQDNAFRVIHDLCKPGGVMFHELPAGGMMTHGLITYTPKFFWNLCRENDYQILFLRVDGYPGISVPSDVRSSNMQFAGADDIPSEMTVPDFAVRAALRKTHDSAFITPLDLPPELMTKRKPRPRIISYFRR
jgi:SAM-dependent methyltransferase